jgi:hypothetical protein
VRGSAAFSAFSLLTFLLDTVSAFDRSVIFKFREVRGASAFPFLARPHFHTERRLGGGRSTGKSSLTISAKPVGVGAASQRLIPPGGRIGLRSYM